MAELVHSLDAGCWMLNASVIIQYPAFARIELPACRKRRTNLTRTIGGDFIRSSRTGPTCQPGECTIWTKADRTSSDSAAADAAVRSRQSHLVVPLAATDCGFAANYPLRGARPYGLRPQRQAAAAFVAWMITSTNLVALVEQLRPRTRHARRSGLGRRDWLGAMLVHAGTARAIVLFNTGAFPPRYIPWRIRACRIPVVGRLAVQGANLFSRAALRMTLARRKQLEPDGRGRISRAVRLLVRTAGRVRIRARHSERPAASDLANRWPKSSGGFQHSPIVRSR